MNIKLLTEHHFEFLTLKEDCTGSSESIHVKIPYCWKSHVAAHSLMILAMDPNKCQSSKKPSSFSSAEMFHWHTASIKMAFDSRAHDSPTFEHWIYTTAL